MNTTINTLHASYSKKLFEAVQKGLSSDIEQLLHVVKFTHEANCALRTAAKEGHIECVKLLLPVTDPKLNSSLALRFAVAEGHLDIVKLLLPVSNIKKGENSALCWAAMNGHLECVKILIDALDTSSTEPLLKESSSLWLATENGHFDIVKLLLPISDYKSVLNHIRTNSMITENNFILFQQCINEYEALQQKERLLKRIDKYTTGKSHLDKRKI